MGASWATLKSNKTGQQDDDVENPAVSMALEKGENKKILE